MKNMKKLNCFLILLILLNSCSHTKSIATGCKENIQFKNIYFNNINIVEAYTIGGDSAVKRGINTQDFLNSIKFISNYSRVSMDKITGYKIGYADYDEFLKDKKEWVAWYNDNKCNDLQ